MMEKEIFMSEKELQNNNMTGYPYLDKPGL